MSTNTPVVIERVANGFILSERTSTMAACAVLGETFVFRDVPELSEFLTKHFSPNNHDSKTSAQRSAGPRRA